MVVDDLIKVLKTMTRTCIAFKIATAIIALVHWSLGLYDLRSEERDCLEAIFGTCVVRGKLEETDPATVERIGLEKPRVVQLDISHKFCINT